jgi:hypothetical protein
MTAELTGICLLKGEKRPKNGQPMTNQCEICITNGQMLCGAAKFLSNALGSAP